jgi:hypothetical protein
MLEAKAGCAARPDYIHISAMLLFSAIIYYKDKCFTVAFHMYYKHGHMLYSCPVAGHTYTEKLEA